MRAYKQTLVVKEIRNRIAEYLAYMKLANKTPGTIWLTKQDYMRLLRDDNKYLASLSDDPEIISRPNDIKGIPVRFIGDNQA